MDNANELYSYVGELCRKAKEASYPLARLSVSQRDGALLKIADKLYEKRKDVLEANAEDVKNAEKNGVIKTMIDRLTLNEARIEGICSSVRELVSLPDVLGRGETWTRPNGLVIHKIKVPLGCVAMIYEARPNVTVDAACLCLKTGNSAVLRGGKEALLTNKATVALIREALSESGIDENAVSLVERTEREGANILMTMRKYVDVLIPRGSAGLIRSVVDNAKVPVIETGAGNCHLYIDGNCDIEKAVRIADNAKNSRPAVCNAIETLLVHEKIAKEFLPLFAKASEKYGLEIRGCEKTREILPYAKAATEEDYATEYDDYIIAVKVVSSKEEAVSHINRFNTGHSEAIVTNDLSVAEYFKTYVDAAAVYVNASTRFTDGGEFGFGAEIGISTQKLHARGPMGLDALTTVKYLVEGSGQIR